MARPTIRVLLYLLAASLLALLACSKPCPTCLASGKVRVEVSCPTCVGTGSVRVTCPTCKGQSQAQGERPCPYCKGQGRLKCAYTRTFPYIAPGICAPSPSALKYAPRETVLCVGGQLQSSDRQVDEAYSRLGWSRLCPVCFGTGESACSFCEGTGRIKGPSVCPTCGGSGQILQTCSACGGKGKSVTISLCPKCKGKGSLGPFS